MNNYEYLIASLPDISKEWKGSEEQSWENIIAEIKGLCSASDNKLVDALLEGYDDSKLCEEFYTKALASKNKFIRDYFTFDLNVRNAKVRYLNKALDRPAGTDIFMETVGEFAEGQKLDGVLDTSDILSRERGIDDLMWEKIDEITTFDYFDIVFRFGFRKSNIRDIIAIDVVNVVSVEIENFAEHDKGFGFEDPVRIFAFKNASEVRNHAGFYTEDRRTAKANGFHSAVGFLFLLGDDKFAVIKIAFLAVIISGKLFFYYGNNIKIIHCQAPFE